MGSGTKSSAFLLRCGAPGSRVGHGELWPVREHHVVAWRAEKRGGRLLLGRAERGGRGRVASGRCLAVTWWPVSAALLQKYLDNYDLSIRIIYVLGTLGFSIGTAVMAMFANVYVAMIMISTMGVVSMSISYCPYALLGQYHDIKEVRGRWGRGERVGEVLGQGQQLWAALGFSPALLHGTFLLTSSLALAPSACGLPGVDFVCVV